MEQVTVHLALVDKAIVLGYLVVVLALGALLSKVASQGVEDYFLGGRKIPWWVLGASGTASNFDMTGTMVIVSLIVILGYKGFWVEMRGGVALPLAFLMVFMGKWTRRSKVMTSAEWMIFRYGPGKQGNAARVLSTVSYLILSVGMVAYFCVGTGTFLETFLPWDRTTCSLVMVSVGLIYTLMSGLYGVVFTDIVQEIIITITAIYISVKAFFMYDPVVMASQGGWADFDIPYRLEMLEGYPASYGEFQLFAWCIVFWVGKAMLEGVGGLGGYMAQRYYAARNEKEAGLLTAEWILLLGFRWTMIAGLAYMAIHLIYHDPTVAAAIKANPEKSLPFVLERMLPAGLKGMAIAGFIAAAMSTFDSTVNAGASYWVKDIYEAYIDPEASPETLMTQSKVSTVVIAAVGIALAGMVENINEIWGFLTGALSAGFMVPLTLRWYWARHNGYGFAWGTGAGIVAAAVVQMNPATKALYISFPIVCLVSLAASIFATLQTEETPADVRLNFYRQIRPVGLWREEHAQLEKTEALEITLEHLNDLISLCLAFPWQLSLFFGCMCFVVHDWSKAAACFITWVFCTIGLYFFWFKNLRDPEDTGEAEEERQADALAAKRAAEREAKKAAEAAAAEAEDGDGAAAKRKAPAKKRRAKKG